MRLTFAFKGGAVCARGTRPEYATGLFHGNGPRPGCAAHAETSFATVIFLFVTTKTATLH
jgi:hypothetical protein